MKPAKTQDEQEAMFAAWCVKQSEQYVANTCSFSRTTIRKYRRKNEWDARIADIHKRTEQKVNNTIAARQARWARQGQALQKVGTTKFYDKDGNLKESVVKAMPAKTAVRAIESGIKIEKEALGEASEKTERRLIVEFVTVNGEEDKPKKKEKKDDDTERS
ncbi:hypothetical protein LCGC14_0421270 [marine sediment metagenome]|uniref:Uncharacterized protein n=1 Tax=marine sediment metagenome TaxID=412755 RepID=A0A0F9SQT7_9ZZZZ